MIMWDVRKLILDACDGRMTMASVAEKWRVPPQTVADLQCLAPLARCGDGLRCLIRRIIARDDSTSDELAEEFCVPVAAIQQIRSLLHLEREIIVRVPSMFALMVTAEKEEQIREAAVYYIRTGCWPNDE